MAMRETNPYAGASDDGAPCTCGHGWERHLGDGKDTAPPCSLCGCQHFAFNRLLSRSQAYRQGKRDEGRAR
jgi:hypothetical protein